VWGHVRLLPPEGATGGGSSGAYSDRRFRDVTLVDYKRPGFAVVYLDADGAPDPNARVRLTIRSSRFGVRLVPSNAVVGVGGRILIENAGADDHVISCPDAGVLRRIPAGGEIEIAATRSGVLSAYLVDVPEPPAVVFVAPGPYAAVSERGRFELRGVPPGHGTVRVWHPRFPPAARQIDVAPDGILQVDVEMRVSQRGGDRDDAR
jgi:hypothetical protein